MNPLVLIVPFIVITLMQDPASATPHLGARVDRVVQAVDAKWVSMGTSGTEVDRIHRWRRLNQTMTLQARQFDNELEARRHAQELVSTLGVPVDETLKIGTFAVRIEWGDGGSTVYLSAGRTAVVISAPSTGLARKLSRQAAVEFSDQQTAVRSRAQ